MMIEDLANLSLHQLQAAYASKSLSPVEVVSATFGQIEEVNGKINALYDLRRDEALAEAAAAEQRYARSEPVSPFDGVPVTIKDSINAIGTTWHHGSAIHGKGVVATSDAPPAARLRQAGAITLGKGIMPDFGLSASGVSSSHGIVRNPWGVGWNPGGSSAGCGASLAAGIGLMAIGSDIAGSVRLPAAHCGLAALKPTQGGIAHTPASTVRSAGPMTRSVADLVAWTRLLSGPDEGDRYSVPLIERDLQRPFIVGASADFGFGPPVDPAVHTCFLAVREALGALSEGVVDVDEKAGFDAYLPIDDSLRVKGWLEYAGADPALRYHTPGELIDWFSPARDWTPDRIGQINQGIERAVAYAGRLLSDVDFLLTPVMPIVNFPAEARGIDPSMPLRHTTFTALFNQSGHPAVVICGGFDDRGLPIGMQLVGKRFDDFRLLKLASQLEARLDLFGPDRRSWPVRPVAHEQEG